MLYPFSIFINQIRENLNKHISYNLTLFFLYCCLPICLSIILFYFTLHRIWINHQYASTDTSLIKSSTSRHWFTKPHVSLVWRADFDLHNGLYTSYFIMYCHSWCSCILVGIFWTAVYDLGPKYFRYLYLIGQILEFMSMKSDVKSPGFILFRANLAHFEPKSNTPSCLWQILFAS